MEKETEKAIQKIGDLSENLNAIMIAFCTVIILLGAYFFIFGLLLPSISNFNECGEISSDFWACNEGGYPAMVMPVELGMVKCDVEVDGVLRNMYFNYGWEEVKAYADLTSDSNVVRCW